MRKGQTWIEFVITTIVFLFIVFFLFLNATDRLKTEVEKVQLQKSCLKSAAIEQLLLQPGEPANWSAGNSVTIFGLSNANRTAVNISKWLKAKEWGFSNISANSTPGSPWRIAYKVYAFEPKIDSTCEVGDAITLCRGDGTLTITANSSAQSAIELALFFPFSTAAFASGTNETSDTITFTAKNGTLVTLSINTNSTDQDSISISFVPKPNLVFIDSLRVTSSQQLPLLLGNISATDSFGAATIKQKNLCTTKIKKQLELASEMLLADFELQAW